MANPYKNTGKAGSPAHFIGPVGKAIVKVGKAFGNTAKQYFKKFTQPKPKGFSRPLVTGNRVYDRKMIDDAFKQRFRTEATRTPEMPKINYSTPSPQGTNFGRADAQVKMREAYRNLDKLK